MGAVLHRIAVDGKAVISSHFRPVERNGMKWDAGMILYEFDALREPEKTRFPQIGDYLRGLGVEFNEVCPQMLWCGHIVPDLYIANRLTAVPQGWQSSVEMPVPRSHNKARWPDTLSLRAQSLISHGKEFHEAFIEPMCEKIAGIPSAEVVARYHRALWLPLYWPQTLRDKTPLYTRFWYPRDGYAGVVGERLGFSDRKRMVPMDSVELTITFLLAKPTREFQVLLVADKSPIYRVTNQDACAGLPLDYCRFVVESRAYCPDIGDEMQRLNLVSGARYLSQMKARLPLPTLVNVRRGWMPAPNLNEQLWSVMNEA